MRISSDFLRRVLFLQQILAISLANVQILTFSNGNSQETVPIIAENEVISQYDYFSQLTSSCVLPTVQTDDELTFSRSFLVQNLNNFSAELSISVSFDSSSLNLSDSSAKSLQIAQNSAVSATFLYDCAVNPKFLDNETVIFSLVAVDFEIKSQEPGAVSQKFQASFLKICQRSASELSPFDASFAILAVLSMIIVFFAVKNQKITSFQQRFPSVCVRWWLSIPYILLVTGFLVLWTRFSEETELVLYVLMVFLSLGAVTFTLKELLYYMKIFEVCNVRVFVQRCAVSVHVFLCFLLALCVVVPWILTKHYILTDVLALFIVFAGFKLFKITSLKHGTLFLLILAVYEVFERLVFGFLSESPLKSFNNSKFCYPLRFEVPTFDDFLTKRCSWLNITNLLFPGLFLSYFHRYDASKKVKIYFLMGFCGYLCGNLVWIVVSLLFAYSSPLLVYTFPVMIGLCSLLAYKRNENLELWEGLFYDYDVAYANIKKSEMEEREMLEEKRDAFENQGLFEGLLDSELDSVGSFEGKEEREKELMVLQKNEGKVEKGGIKKKIKAFEGMKMLPGMSITNKEELEKVLKNKKK